MHRDRISTLGWGEGRAPAQASELWGSGRPQSQGSSMSLTHLPDTSATIARPCGLQTFSEGKERGFRKPQ